MTKTALERRQTALFGEIETATNLPAGSVHICGLTLTNPDLPFDEWQRIGQTLGAVGRWTPWAIGDWLLFGDAVYGEDAAQAVESRPDERYSIATRFTGLAPETMKNYVRVCEGVKKKQRRPDLHFSVHEPVYRLEPDEQTKWLKKAVEEGWTREQLRDAIRAEKDGLVLGDDPPTILEPPLSKGERIERAAHDVLSTASMTSDGMYQIPPEPMARLREAFGEE